ncbi:MFS transporter, partial [Alteromonas sp. 5E99-2]|uniref:MFS transporter n=1 Tax=Alteromonas sp. 5E99-2 TaxID=2817683 RepID=UPI001A99BB04
MAHKLSFIEKSGYAMGDAAANLVWRGALAYLAVFYTDTFGLTASAAAILFLVVRLSDGITDIIMGMVADRTQTKWGKFRPWIVVSTPFLCLFMVLCFTTPDFSPNAKLVYAYVTYIGLTLAYTFNNVPYSALMGVMTPSDTERTRLSSYRFAGAFLGGLAVMGGLPELVQYFGQGNSAQGYQYAMYLFAALLAALMIITVSTTRERVHVPTTHTVDLKTEMKELAQQLPFIMLPLLAITLFFYYRSIPTFLFAAMVFTLVYLVIRKLLASPESERSRSQQDIIDLLTNRPWLILLGMGFLTMMYNGIKYGVIAYYFKYAIQDEALAGGYFAALLVVSVAGALATNFLVSKLGRKNTFIAALLLSSAFVSVLFWVPPSNLVAIFTIGCISEFFAAMMPTLFFAMLGDSADFSEWKTGRRATGLFYSAGTFVQKTGGGFAGALVLVVL